MDVVRKMYSAWAEGKLDALLGVCDPEVELLTSGSFPTLRRSIAAIAASASFGRRRAHRGTGFSPT